MRDGGVGGFDLFAELFDRKTTIKYLALYRYNSDAQTF